MAEGEGETNSSISALKPIKTLLSPRPLILGHNPLQHRLRNIPQLIMLTLHQQNRPAALAIERTGHMKNRLLDNLLDLGV